MLCLGCDTGTGDLLSLPCWGQDEVEAGGPSGAELQGGSLLGRGSAGRGMPAPGMAPCSLPLQAGLCAQAVRRALFLLTTTSGLRRRPRASQESQALTVVSFFLAYLTRLHESAASVHELSAEELRAAQQTGDLNG